MRFSLMPDERFDTFRDADVAFLKAAGIRALLLDIDNTLEPYENPEPGEDVRVWLSSLSDAGIGVAFVSNNDAKRVERFNRDLGYPAFYKAKKPLGKFIRRAMRILGTTPKETALMGDQIFTDVLAAHLSGLRAYLVPPIRDRRDALTRFKRRLERPILKRWERKHRK